MEWEIEYTDEFEAWWDQLTEDEQVDVNAKIILLQRFGPALRRPHSGVISGSKHSHMKELIVQHIGKRTAAKNYSGAETISEYLLRPA